MDGYAALKAARTQGPEKIRNEVLAANLRGRGGAGFLTGVKWGFLPDDGRKRYLVCNADESEPGTFKDRDLLRYTPHLVLEGILLAAHATGAKKAIIYIRGEYAREAEVLEQAIREAKDYGVVGCELMVCRGAGAYVCGEETALLNSLEGKRGEPRVKPPYPASSGVFGFPTIVNNVETLCNIPFIVRRGGKWFASLGRFPDSGGTRLLSVSGHVMRPGLYEIPSGGYTLRQIIYDLAGGISSGRELKAVIPGGTSTAVLLPEETDVPYDFEPLAKLGSSSGSGGVIVVSDAFCVVRLLSRIVRFYAHESCGQCTPCREGVRWLCDIVERIERGRGREEDLDLLLEISENINGKSLCALGEAVAAPVASFVRKFRNDFEAHIRGGRCPSA
jgi:NADH-quinone oxidoreductase subunit F